MRCVSTALFDEAGNAAGVMCINFNIAAFEDRRSTLDLFLRSAGVVAQPVELFKDDWQERINTFLHGWLRERQIALNSLTREHRRELVEALHAQGAFKGSARPTMSPRCSAWDARRSTSICARGRTAPD